MPFWLWIVLALAVVGTALYLRTGLIAGLAGLAVLLAAWTALTGPGWLALTAAWLPFALVAGLLGLPPLRRRLVTGPVLERFRASLPTLSQTEREALEAGTVWWDGALFSGKPAWKRLLDTPLPDLTEAEQAFLDGPVEQLCELVDDWAVTKTERDLPPEVWAFIKDNGFFGLIIPEEYGGLGFSPMAHSAVVSKLASRSVTAAVTVMVPNSLGPAELLMHYGTDHQKAHYLPRLARGEEVPCFALTGPEAGSDAGAMTDTGVVTRADFRGERGVLGIRLNWDKRYITLGPVATVLGLAFQLHDPDRLLGDRAELGITLALVPADLEGVEIGRRHLPLDIPFQNGPTRGRDVFIPIDWIIGGREQAGKGWRMLMEALAAGRSISLPALATGAGKLTARTTGAYARVREQFHRPIGRFEGVAEALARIAGRTYQMEATRELTAAAVANGERPGVLTAIAKYHLTEAMRGVVNDGMDVHGGKAICVGPSNLLARAYQAVPIGITVEGANILTRSMIVFGQGAIRCHPHLLREMTAAEQGDGRAFDRAFIRHVGFIASNAVRAPVLGLTGGWLARTPGPKATRAYLRRLSRLSAAFALTADVALLVLGGSLKRRESLSARLGDCLSHLYMASAVVRHFHERGAPQAELPQVRWALADHDYRAREALAGFYRNFPSRPVAWALRGLAFPLGLGAVPPSDRAGRAAADTILASGAGRDALTDGIHLPAAAGEPLADLEEALVRAEAAEPVERALGRAIKEGRLERGAGLVERAVSAGVIDADGAEALRRAEAARQRVIAVDDFPADLAQASPGEAPAPRAEARP